MNRIYIDFRTKHRFTSKKNQIHPLDKQVACYYFPAAKEALEQKTIDAGEKRDPSQLLTVNLAAVLRYKQIHSK